MSTLNQLDNDFSAFGDEDDDYGLENVDYDPINRDEYAEYQTGGEAQQEEEKPAFDKDKYKQSNVGLIVALVVILLLGGAAAGYFFWWQPKQEAEAKAKQEEELKAKKEQERKDSIARVEQEAARLEAARRQAEQDSIDAANAQPEVGSINTITEKTGRSFVVVGSFVDEDFAMDFAKRLTEQGKSVSILAPADGRGFYRVAVADFENYADAMNSAEEVKTEGSYGADIWALRY